MTFHDDWFAEPAKPGPTRKHEAYTRRLVAWGWLHREGVPMWEVGPLMRLSDVLREVYVPALKRDLNRTVFGGDDAWVWNPEAPVS